MKRSVKILITYFNMVPRTTTPNKLSPPSPMTIAVSELLVLLHSETLSISEVNVKNEKATVYYICRNAENLNCHCFSLKYLSIPPTQSAHFLPTYSFLPTFLDEAVICNDGNRYRIFPCTKQI